MPVADHILHQLELFHNTLSLRIIPCQLRNVASSLTRDPVLMQYLFGERSFILPQFGHQAQRDTKRLRALGNVQLAGCAL